jgi:hypothetical protein
MLRIIGIVAPMSWFAAYLDLLRNESPVYGQMDGRWQAAPARITLGPPRRRPGRSTACW